MSTVLITGNTYPVKDQIKALGGRWNGDAKGWMVPADKANAARALVSGAPKQAFRPAEKAAKDAYYSHLRAGGSRYGAKFEARRARYATRGGECNCHHCRSGSESLCTR